MSGKGIRKLILAFLFLLPAAPGLDAPASAYVVGTTEAGMEIKWQVPSASYFINTAGGPAGSLEAIRAGMRTWSVVPGSAFTFGYAGATTATAHGVDDGQSIVTFAPMGVVGVLAENFYWYDTPTGLLLDSDIRFNTDFAWSAAGAPGFFDVQSLAVHELGHSLSLEDLPGIGDSEKTMYASAFAGETKKRTLDPDDMAGIVHLYPGPPSKVPRDFDGDRKADIAVYRPSSGVWYLLPSSAGYDPAQYQAYKWGDPTDVPVPGDYDGDGVADIAVRRPSTGMWYILQSSDGYDQARYKEYAWGNATDNVVAGDFDGDGKTDIAIYRPADGVWYLLQSSDGYNPNLYKSYLWGNATDLPVSGDFDEDGKTDISVYRRSDGVWYILQSSDGYAPGLYKSYKWGGDPDDVPVPGDYDGDGKTDIAVYRPSSGVWYILQSTDGYAQSRYKAYKWGGDPGDVPVPGDHDGDGKTDIVLYRPSSGVWYLLLSTDGYAQSLYKAYLWGGPSDMPVKGGD